MLAYIPDPPFRKLINFLRERFTIARLVNYEMMNGNDRFGKMMVSNF